MTEVQWLLAHLAEEAAELAQAAMKGLEYGLESSNLASIRETNNALDIVKEHRDVCTTMGMLRDRGVLRLPLPTYEAVKEKEDKILAQMEVARSLGVITE